MITLAAEILFAAFGQKDYSVKPDPDAPKQGEARAVVLGNRGHAQNFLKPLQIFKMFNCNPHPFSRNLLF